MVDTEPSQYSVMFNFHNNGDDINKWQIGFYMPRSFYSLTAQNINPALEMQVCNADGDVLICIMSKRPSICLIKVRGILQY